MSFERQILFIRARTPSTAGYSYGNSFAVRLRLNTDPNLTPNPIRTHDRAPNRPRSQKNFFSPGGSRTRDLRQKSPKRYYSSPSALATELSKHTARHRSAAKWVYKRHVIYTGWAKLSDTTLHFCL